MQEQQDIKELLLSLDRDKNKISQLTSDKELNDFLIEWFLFAENQIKKTQQQYIWSLMNGWELTSFAEKKNIQTERSADTVEVCQIIQKTPSQFQQIHQNNVCLNFLSNHQAIIKQNSTFFWINPTQLDKDIINLTKHFQYFLVVVTTSDFWHLFTLFDLMTLNLSFRVITLEPIYLKIKMLLSFLKKRDSQRYSNLVLGRFYFLKVDQYFQYAGFLWRPINSCWYEPSYDLLIRSNLDNNHHFLLQSYKVTQTKYIYYGWKKGFITETNYQQYTSSQGQGIQTAKIEKFYKISNIAVRNPKEYEYIDFKKKELIRDIDEEDQEEVWNCLQEISYTAGQIVVKKGTIFDYMFIIFDGEFVVQRDGTETEANKRQFYGLTDLKKDLNHHSYTLKCIKKGTVKRIQKWNLSCILYKYLY